MIVGWLLKVFLNTWPGVDFINNLRLYFTAISKKAGGCTLKTLHGSIQSVGCLMYFARAVRYTNKMFIKLTTGRLNHKTFSVITYEWGSKLECLLLTSLFSPLWRMAVRTEPTLSGVPFEGRLVALPKNISLGLKRMPRTNTLAYLAHS
jgi:hypothetical protein